MVDGAIWRTARWTPRPTTSLAPTRLLPPEPLLAQSLPPATSTLYRIHAVPNPRCTESTLYRIHALPNPRCTESTLYRIHAVPNPRSIDSTATPTGPSASAISPFGANRTRRARPLHAVGHFCRFSGTAAAHQRQISPTSAPLSGVSTDDRELGPQPPAPPNERREDRSAPMRMHRDVSAISPFGHKSDRTHPASTYCRGTTAAHRTLLPSTGGR
jgi:hypothetical protein